MDSTPTNEIPNEKRNNSNYSFKEEKLFEIKGKYPNFPEIEEHMKNFVAKYPSFVYNKNDDNITNDSGERKKIILNEILDYKKRLADSSKKEVELLFGSFINNTKIKGIFISNPQDLKLLNTYKVLIMQQVNELIEDKMKLILKNNGIPPGLFMLNEPSIIKSAKALALKIGDMTSLLMR